MTYYKLTDANGCTYGGTQWGEGATHKAQGAGSTLCTGDVIHVYDSPLKAVFMNPIQGKFNLVTAKLWKCRVRQVVADDGTKVGVKECTTIEEAPLPVLTIEQRVEVAIRIARLTSKDAAWNRWADRWLDGSDRSSKSAYAASAAAADAAYAANAASAAAAAAAAADAAAYAAASAATDAAEAYSAAAAEAAGEWSCLLNQVLRKVKEESNGRTHNG